MQAKHRQQCARPAAQLQKSPAPMPPGWLVWLQRAAGRPAQRWRHQGMRPQTAQRVPAWQAPCVDAAGRAMSRLSGPSSSTNGSTPVQLRRPKLADAARVAEALDALLIPVAHQRAVAAVGAARDLVRRLAAQAREAVAAKLHGRANHGRAARRGALHDALAVDAHVVRGAAAGAAERLALVAAHGVALARLS